MSFRLNYTDIHPQSPCYPPKNILILQRTCQIRESRVWRRRRLKTNRKFTVRNQLGPFLSHSFENLFQNLIYQFPSVNSFDLIAPALGFASGVALYLSRFKYNKNSSVSDIGEWILFTSPTPFNRFVLLRCPSISFEGSDLFEDVNEKLVKEDRHFVRLNCGRIQVQDLDGRNGVFEEKLVYQRVCVSTDDGGVISLDWPANLVLAEEHGMDTTLLLVPGTAEGSMDKNIRSFVCESLKHGCFPVVMNPRGCAGSPLTTARLFTAADSDDISTAIQFINRARPWTTLMGVGWGYGANMLTKYLAEVRERTPLTAATCIDNPFDLEEATRSSPHHISVDQKLRGLIDILQSNKELFQGRVKGFNVEKALSATSVRDFEKAISMVSYGFEAIEEFYSKSSTRELVGNIKIPVLFIQSDNGTVPLFSIPRSLIAENPFTSLLLCSCLPSSVISSDRYAIYWCQHLAIEWLTAVELGLLKGRHPLLKDVDVSINPSKGLALVESRPSDEHSSSNNLLSLTPSDAINGYSVDPIKEMLEDHDTTAASVCLRSGQDSLMKRSFELEGVGLRQEENSDVLQQTNSVDAESVKEAGDNPIPADSERGQGLQTAQVVMNILDKTMPGTLAEEHKKKVLTAVDQGETLMKALQEAVPEDVRGKLTAAVSGIVQTRGTNLNLDELLRIGRIPNVSSELKSKIQEKVGLSSAEGGYEDRDSSDQTRSADELSNNTDNNQPSMEKPAGGIELELQPSQKLQKSVDLGPSQSESSHGGDNLSSGRMDANESERSHEQDEFSKERVAQNSDYSEPGSETGGRPNPHGRSEKASETEEEVGELDKVNQDSDIAQENVKEVNNVQNKEEKGLDTSTDQNKPIPPTKTEETVSPISLSEAPPSSTKSEEPSTSILPASNPPSFSVSQALDTLTGMDDSTQMAVNSVFGVIENMITQLEEDYGNDGEQDNNADKDRESGSASEGPPITSENKLEKIEDNKNDLSLQSDLLQSDNYPVSNCHEKSTDSHQDAENGWEKKPTQSLTSSFSSSIYSSQEDNTSTHVDKENDEKGKEHLIGSKSLAESSDKLRRVHKIPLYVTINPYGDSMYNEHLRNLLLKMQNTKSLDLDTTTALFLDYFPEEGQWKLLEQPGSTKDSIDDIATCEKVNETVRTHSPEKANETEKIIEPSYVILDVEKHQKSVGDYETADRMNDKSDICSDRSDELMHLIKNIILDSLKVEVGRKLGQPDMQQMESNLARDLEQVSDAVSMAVGRKEHTWCLESEDPVSEKVGTLHGEHIIRAISSSVQDTSYLRKILPVGVIVGSSLAGLRKYFNVAALHDNGQSEAAALDHTNNVMENFSGKVGEMGNDHKLFDKKDLNYVVDSSISRDGEIAESKDLNNDTFMVSAVTAALGASALLVHQRTTEPYRRDVTAEVSSKSLNVKENHQKEPYKLEEAASEQNQNNMVTSLAEKAMSVAGPVVPTKSGGEVDQDRLVAMLADLGQKGGMLRLLGKVALLWGGIRGAMSLTDKLILFLRLAERPLFQRILGFVCMVLVLWSPVVVPLFPTLVQSWATHNSSRIAEFACVLGLYTAVMILVMIWGKRIRGYENPLEQYGMDLTSSPKLRDVLKGLIGGVILILSIHSINALLGYACLSWPPGLPSSSLDAKSLLKVYGKMLILAGRGIVTATGVAIVEELLFRSWLPEEIAVDLGYHRGFIISGLAFSIFQRSPRAIPGLWLLSLVLTGARHRSDGSLSLPIGMRAGIIASSFVLQMGGFLTYRSNSPLWLTGAHPFQPFGGVVGIAFSFLLALVLYPRQPLLRKNIVRTIRE